MIFCMSNFTVIFNHVLGVATILGQMALVGLVVLYFLKKNVVSKFFGEYALNLTVLVLGTGVFLSLFYSEVLHILPCDLCWYQRIFIYSGFVIGTVGLWKKDTKILSYIMVLMVICLIIGIDNYYVQWGGASLIPCATNVAVSPCAKKEVLEFGYVTIPLMSVTSSLGVLLLYAFNKKFAK